MSLFWTTRNLLVLRLLRYIPGHKGSVFFAQHSLIVYLLIFIKKKISLFVLYYYTIKRKEEAHTVVSIRKRCMPYIYIYSYLYIRIARRSYIRPCQSWWEKSDLKRNRCLGCFHSRSFPPRRIYHGVTPSLRKEIGCDCHRPAPTNSYTLSATNTSHCAPDEFLGSGRSWQQREMKREHRRTRDQRQSVTAHFAFALTWSLYLFAACIIAVFFSFFKDCLISSLLCYLLPVLSFRRKDLRRSDTARWRINAASLIPTRICPPLSARWLAEAEAEQVVAVSAAELAVEEAVVRCLLYRARSTSSHSYRRATRRLATSRALLTTFRWNAYLKFAPIFSSFWTVRTFLKSMDDIEEADSLAMMVARQP